MYNLVSCVPRVSHQLSFFYLLGTLFLDDKLGLVAIGSSVAFHRWTLIVMLSITHALNF